MVENLRPVQAIRTSINFFNYNKFDVFILGDLDATYLKPEQQQLIVQRVRNGAGLVMLGYLAGHAATVYPKIARSGERLRREIERVFAEAGLRARCTGDGNDVIRGSSLFMVHFPRSADVAYDRPEDIHDPGRSDLPLREDLLKLALLVNGVNVVHGGGAVSSAHGAKEIEATIAAYAEAARLFKKYLD